MAAGTVTRTVQVNVVGDSSKLSGALNKTAADAETSGGRISKALSKAFGGISLGKLQTGADGVTSSLEGMGRVGSSALGSMVPVAGAVAGALVGIGAESIKNFDQFEQVHTQLVNAVSNSGSSFSTFAGQVSSLDSKFAKFGYTEGTVESALAGLVTATGNPIKALGDMGLAANIAAARHTDLASATDIVAKAQTGNTRALMQMGISLPVVSSSALKLQQAQEAVTKAQAALQAALAKSTTGSQTQAKALIVQQTATLAVQTAEHRLDVARQSGQSPAVVAELQQRLAIAEGRLAVATQASQGPTTALTTARANLAKAQANLNAQTAAAPSIMDALNQRFGGAAAAQASTYAGKMAALSAQVHDLSDKLGAELEPALVKTEGFLANTFIPAIAKSTSDIGKWASDINQWAADVYNLGSGKNNDANLWTSAGLPKPNTSMTATHPVQVAPSAPTASMTATGAPQPANYMPGTYSATDPMTAQLLQKGYELGRVTAPGPGGGTISTLNVTINGGVITSSGRDLVNQIGKDIQQYLNHNTPPATAP